MISLLLPSRGRPDNIARLHSSLVATSSGPWELVIRLDDDDPTRDAYPTHANIIYSVGPRVVLSQYWNECHALAQGPIFCHAGDDIVFHTPNWDRLVAATFPADGIAFVHGDDGSVNGRLLGTHGFLHQRWVDTVGTFCPPYFSSDYNDLWFNEVANALGRRIFVPIITEHMHPAFGKAEWDDTHRERIARHQADNVEQIWQDKQEERERWVTLLRQQMD